MNINEINKITLPTIKEFPYEKLFFNSSNSIWSEAVSVSHSDIAELKIFPIIIPKSRKLMCMAGFINDSDCDEYDIYCIYSDNENEETNKIYFLTIAHSLGTFTFSYQYNKWEKWS